MPCGFAARKVAALESITLLTYPRLTASSGLLSRCFLHLCYDWSLCLAQLTPAYGVTSIPFLPGCHRPFHRSNCLRSLPLLSLWLLAFRYLCFFLLLLLLPSRHYASAFPHVNRLRSPALHPVFQQLVPTAVGLLLHPVVLVVFRYSPLMVFAEGEGFEPPCHF